MDRKSMTLRVTITENPLGITDLFKKRNRDEITGTNILVATLDPKFSALAQADKSSFAKFYTMPQEESFNDVEALLDAIRKGYDVVHLFCDVSEEGNINDQSGRQISGTALVQTCCDSGVKLLWVASANRPNGYIKGFKVQGKPLNLVMTINRAQANFGPFLEKLLSKMSGGLTMPLAWVEIAPQNPNSPQQQDLPECIFFAGRGSAVLR
jgi:hypothetical protein